MTPARHPSERREQVRLLVLEGQGTNPASDHAFDELPDLLEPGDLLVVNDAATLPASLHGRIADGSRAAIELRLVGPVSEADALAGRRWWAVLFGAGDWRTDTDLRPTPPSLDSGVRLVFDSRPGDPLYARVLGRSTLSARLISVELDAPHPWAGIYTQGRPIQYSHVDAPLEAWSVQTLFAGRPWAVEMPSAGRPLTADLLARLRARGISIASLTHAAGLSATGDARIDAALPLPERYEIPAVTVAAIDRTRARGGRVIAAGTTVVRALESAALDGPYEDDRLRAGAGLSTLKLDATHRLRIVDALLTGMHAPGESHYLLLQAFNDESRLADAWQQALEHDYRSHEFGDAALIWATPDRRPTRLPATSRAASPWAAIQPRFAAA